MKCLMVGLLLWPAACFSASAEIAKLSFEEFDQSQGSGWRALADTGKYEDAAHLIVRYINEAKPAKLYLPILNFHAGQCYAFAGDIEAAVERFQQSYQLEEPASYAPFAKQWNAYVRGTIAFLKSDRKELEKCRAEVAAGPDDSMRKSNGVVIDRMISGIDKAYLEVYRGE